MKRTTAWTIVAALGLVVGDARAADGVKIEKADQEFAVTAPVYTARVDSNGSLSSLVIGGVEFMNQPVEVPVGATKRVIPPLYACPMNNWNLPYRTPGPGALTEDRVKAEGNGWWIEYRFLPDAIELTYFGAPEGARGFRAGYPMAELTLSLAPHLSRACDPENQGELGWPIARAHEPGNFAVLATNGAGFSANDVCRMQSGGKALNFMIFNTYDPAAKPIQHTLKILPKPELKYSLTMEIVSPNPNHVFPGASGAVFPVRVTALYGQTLKGAIRFKGAPYVWKTPEVVSEVPVELTPAQASVNVDLPIKPSKPGHYIGMVSITEGTNALYNKRIGFMFQPEGIPPAQPPADFDAFWDSNLVTLANSPMDLTLEPQKDKETAAGVVYKAKFRAWGGRWAWAWLTVPKAEGKFPATIICPPVSVWQPGQAQPADGALRIQVAIHGGDISDYPAKPDFDYMNSGITNRETYMLRYSYSCLVRCFDIIKAHEKCNGTVLVQGSSQGAGLALLLSGLRQPDTASGVAIALCRIDWTVLGFAQWGPGCPPGEDPKKIAAVVEYFDPANFAHRIRTPLRLGLGLFDSCAPAEGIFTAINALPKTTPCEVFVDPYGGHSTLDIPAFGKGEKGLEVPRWHGTAADNKMRE